MTAVCDTSMYLTSGSGVKQKLKGMLVDHPLIIKCYGEN